MKIATTRSTASKKSRTIINPVQRDQVIFLETSRESNDCHTLVEVLLAPGGGNPLHYHETFSEEFTCLDGVLALEVDGAIIHLQPGESATAPIRSKHRFFNPGSEPCQFLCRIAPGCPGFEQILQIGYGLARDGKVNRQGAPSNPYALGYMMLISDTCLTGWSAVMQPLLRWFGRQAIKKGLAADWQRRYVTIR